MAQRGSSPSSLGQKNRFLAVQWGVHYRRRFRKRRRRNRGGVDRPPAFFPGGGMGKHRFLFLPESTGVPFYFFVFNVSWERERLAVAVVLFV